MDKQASSYIFIDSRNRNIEARLSCSFSKRGKWNFARCPELDLIDQGQTQKEAFENLVNMISGILLDAVETGKITEVLRAYGFRRKRIPMPDRDLYQLKRDCEEVPLSITAKIGTSEFTSYLEASA